MTSSVQDHTSLCRRRQRAALRSAAFLAIGVLGTLAAIGALLQPLPPAGGLVLALLEGVALLGFFRFGWWISHLHTIERRLAGMGAAPVEEKAFFW